MSGQKAQKLACLQVPQGMRLLAGCFIEGYLAVLGSLLQKSGHGFKG